MRVCRPSLFCGYGLSELEACRELWGKIPAFWDSAISFARSRISPVVQIQDNREPFAKLKCRKLELASTCAFLPMYGNHRHCMHRRRTLYYPYISKILGHLRLMESHKLSLAGMRKGQSHLCRPNCCPSISTRLLKQAPQHINCTEPAYFICASPRGICNVN